MSWQSICSARTLIVTSDPVNVNTYQYSFTCKCLHVTPCKVNCGYKIIKSKLHMVRLGLIRWLWNIMTEQRSYIGSWYFFMQLSETTLHTRISLWLWPLHPGKCSEESAVKCTLSDSGWQEAYDMFLSSCSSLQSDRNSSLVQVSGTLSKKGAACSCSISQEIANSP